jgi:hypothetical protein
MRILIDRKRQNCWLKSTIVGTVDDFSPLPQSYQNKPNREVYFVPDFQDSKSDENGTEIKFDLSQANAKFRVVRAFGIDDVMNDKIDYVLTPEYNLDESLPAPQTHFTEIILLISKTGMSDKEIYEENYDRYRIYCAKNNYPIPPRIITK